MSLITTLAYSNGEEQQWVKLWTPWSIARQQHRTALVITVILHNHHALRGKEEITASFTHSFITR